MAWKDTVAKAYTTVPKTLKEGLWKTGVGITVLSSLLTGFALWRNPQLLMGAPVDRQSIVERLGRHEDIKKEVWDTLEEFFFDNRPFGLMLVAWEELDSMFGIWVRPADKIPGKAGPHDLSPDIRTLGGPFLFGECAQTASLAMPNKVMIACPISNSHRVWGYVAIVVDAEKATELRLRLVEVLAHRLTSLIY